MADILNQGWLARNELSTYPVAPWGTLGDTTSSFVLPNDFLVALYLPVSAGLQLDPSQFFVSSIASYPSGYSLEVGYNGTSPPTVAASASIAAATLAGQEFVEVALNGVGQFADTVGRLIIGSTQGILQQPPGLFTFDLAATQLDLDCIQTQVRGVTSLSVNNGVETLGPFYGDITLSAGTNFEISYVNGGVQLNAISGAGLSASCVCDDSPSPGTPITSVNGIPASAVNGFTLQGDDCIQVTHTANGFSLADLCSKPCCGPTELEAIAAELAQFASEVATLRQFISSLQAVQATTSQAVLGSKIGDQGCVSCS